MCRVKPLGAGFTGIGLTRAQSGGAEHEPNSNKPHPQGIYTM